MPDDRSTLAAQIRKLADILIRSNPDHRDIDRRAKRAAECAKRLDLPAPLQIQHHDGADNAAIYWLCDPAEGEQDVNALTVREVEVIEPDETEAGIAKRRAQIAIDRELLTGIADPIQRRLAEFDINQREDELDEGTGAIIRTLMAKCERQEVEAWAESWRLAIDDLWRGSAPADQAHDDRPPVDTTDWLTVGEAFEMAEKAGMWKYKSSVTRACEGSSPKLISEMRDGKRIIEPKSVDQLIAAHRSGVKAAEREHEKRELRTLAPKPVISSGECPGCGAVVTLKNGEGQCPKCNMQSGFRPLKRP